MTDHYQPTGPYYLTLYCENADAAEIVNTVYVDGFDSEPEAWNACNAIGRKTLDGVDAAGEAVSVGGETILQVLITKAAGADFPQSFAA